MKNAWLKEKFVQVEASTNNSLHQQIAQRLDKKDYAEISYHYAACGRIKKAIDILILNIEELIGSGASQLIYNQICSYEKQIQDDEKGAYYYLLGKILIARGEYDLAIDKLKINSNNDSQSYLFESFIELSKCYEKKTDYIEALNALKRAENYIDKEDKTKYALIDINKGFLLCHQEKISKGINLCEAGLKKLTTQGEISTNLIADGYCDLGWNYTISGNYKKAVSALEKAKQYYINTINSRGIALADVRLARIYWQKGKLNSGLETIKEAEKLSILTEDPQLQAFALRQKGLILWSMGSFNEALRIHRKSFKIYSKIKDSWGIAASLENVAAVLHDLGKSRFALTYINKAIEVCDSFHTTDFLAYAYLYKSRILIKQNNICSAKQYAKKSISLLKKWRYSSYYLGMALMSLGLAYLADHKFVLSYLVLTHSQKVLSKGGATYQQHLSEYYRTRCRNKIFKKLCNKFITQPLSCYEYLESIGAYDMAIFLRNQFEEGEN